MEGEKCVYCAVRTEYLNIFRVNFALKYRISRFSFDFRQILFLMQTLQFKYIKINSLSLKQNKCFSQAKRFNINQSSKFCGPFLMYQR